MIAATDSLQFSTIFFRIILTIFSFQVSLPQLEQMMLRWAFRLLIPKYFRSELDPPIVRVYIVRVFIDLADLRF